MPSPRSAEPASRRSRARGAHVSTKQLARAVSEGRLITCRTSVGDVTGYLCGMDDYHFVVITPAGRQVMVHKAQAPIVVLHSESTYSEEQNIVSLETIVGPFRQYVEKTYLGRATSIPRAEEL